jgi:site-specific DNA recombinase
MKAAIYVRVSTIEQAEEGYSISAQISLLNDYSKTFNYDVYKIYQDAGISGKNIKDRPALKDLLKDARNKRFDLVIVWKLSRLSRSLVDLLSMVDIFTQHGISFQSYSEKFDTSTPIGKNASSTFGIHC